MELNIHNLIDDAKCFEAVRNLRWPNEIKCPYCQSNHIVKRGKDDAQEQRQRYGCKGCNKRFDDLTGTVFAGHHQSLKVWIIFLYFMGLNLSTAQIARELSLNKDDAYYMSNILRTGIVENKSEPELTGEVECDEVYVVAGHKGRPDSVKKKEENQGAIG